VPNLPSAAAEVGKIQLFTLPSGPQPSRSADGPLDPPPECFSTPTPIRIRSCALPAFRLPYKSARLVDGFAPLYAPAVCEPRGLGPDDWARFLGDVQLAAAMAQDGVSAVAPRRQGAPMAVGRSILSGPRAAAGGPYDKAFLKTPVDEVRFLSPSSGDVG
jgi:hypothetical protein